ncbi:MAG: HDOD domain-containing protein [Chitinivibrionales bacterium]|nr:HDOD domain-containing protein [Chitinivibrionales bacterium]MBD3394039.1 HDOD domain-containing protein [Chitinivibrionales bacterium]
MSVYRAESMQTSQPDSRRIRRITESIIGLPTLPTVVSKMIELVDNPKTSAASLARLISTDQSLTAKVLKLANSAYYGFSREISTVNMAIVVMGFNAVRDMGLSLSVFDVFKEATGTRSFDPTRFWEHSIACGVAAKVIARKHHHRFAGEAFVAGLLHDIGKVVLNQYAHKDFTDIMNRTAQGQPLDEVELQVVGTSHGEIGGWLADKWRLPVVISDSIRYHHEPWKSTRNPVLVAIVSLANYLCHTSNIGQSGRPTPRVPGEETWKIFRDNDTGIEETDLENLETEFLLELDSNDTFLSFMRADEEDEGA